MKKIILIGLILSLVIIAGCSKEEKCAGLSYLEALEIAKNSDCVSEGNLIEAERFCNAGTKTWWIEMDIEKEGCNPACVVKSEDRTAEINWRCTGVVDKVSGSTVKLTGGSGDSISF